MASPPPHEVVNHQLPVTGSPPPETVPSPAEEADEHQEFIDSNMPYSPSLNSVDCHLPEYSVPPPPDDSQLTHYPVDQPPPPEEQILDNQPPSPPPTATELPPENDEVKEPPLERPPSTLPSVHVDPPESPNLITNPNPNPNFEPVSQPPPSPSQSPSPSTAEPPPESSILKPPPSPSPSDKPEKNPNFDTNPKAESPIAQQLSSPEENNGSLSLMKLENSPKPSPRSHSPKSPKENSLPPLGVPLYNAVTTFIPSKPVISPWTHDETANLIQAYQEKWYSIKKGPLKAGQWEEVAVTVAARCGYDEPTKTSKQCRHKMEKLRKRYRQERGKPRSRANAWDFFKLMDNLEKGPLPISSSPMEVVEYRKPPSDHVNGNKRKSDVVGGGEFVVSKRSARVRNSNDRGNNVNGGLVGSLPFSDGVSRIVKGLRTPVVHKPREYYQPSYGVQKKVEEEQEEEDDDGSDNDGGEDTVTQLAAEIKGFAEKFVRMEKNKIEMIRDVERYRMEMENKRMEMIRESQQMLVETVNRAFGGSNKALKLSAK
ncbi:MADF domain-containing protein [Tanacetum coccineum]